MIFKSRFSNVQMDTKTPTTTQMEGKHYVVKGTQFCLQCNRLLGNHRFGINLLTYNEDEMITGMGVDIYERLKEIGLVSEKISYIYLTLNQWYKIEQTIINNPTFESECISEPKTSEGEVQLFDENNKEVILTNKEAHKFYRFIKQGDKNNINSTIASAIIKSRKNR